MAKQDQLFELLDGYFRSMRAAWNRQENCSPESPEFEAIQNELSDDLRSLVDRITEHVDNLGRRRFGKEKWEWRYKDAEELADSQLDEGQKLLDRSIGEIDSAPDDLHSRVALRIAAKIYSQLKEWRDTEWIAAVPLEWRFEEFPPLTPLGDGYFIVNARSGGSQGTHRDCFYDFQRILADDLEVTFHPPGETERSYLEVGRKLSENCGGYIPGRPQLVFDLGKGSRHIASLRLRRKIVVAGPLLRLCQLFCVKNGEIKTGRTPDGKRELIPGFAEIPRVALGLVRNRGAAELWENFVTDPVPSCEEEDEAFRDTPSLLEILDEYLDDDPDLPTRDLHPPRGWQFNYLDRIFEPSEGSRIEPVEFLGVWETTGAPLLNLRKEGDTLARTYDKTSSDDLINGVGDAVCHVARCLDGLGGSLLLNCVEATEWLLNPTGEDRGRVRARFADRAEALSSGAGGDRQLLKGQARKLYDYRCDEVHKIGAMRRQVPRVYSRRALVLFATCLRYIADWISKTEDATPKEFEAHLQTLTDSR